MIQSSNSEKFERMAQKLQENCQQFDALNLQLDELIAKVEDDILFRINQIPAIIIPTEVTID
jgi:hypothetical protein